MIDQVSEEEMKSTISTLQNYNNRHRQAQTGVEAAHWIRDKYQGYIDKITDPKRRARFSVKLFTHSFIQPSVVVRMEGNSNIKNEVVIIGGHIDSLAGGANARAPGADDDASGTSCVIESFRVVSNDENFDPDRSVEWHGYAGEEGGLLGSQHIAQTYKNNQVKVHAMLQMDMTGYNPPQNLNEVGIITDFTDAGLNTLLRNVYRTYGQLPTRDTLCGYACSDHASWNRAGYRSSFGFEVGQFNILNPRIHTANDLLQYLDTKRQVGFAKAAIGFATENSK